MRRCLKNRDQYGHDVMLNFNRKKNYVPTWIGGIVTMLVNLSLCTFLMLKLRQSLLHEKDTNVTTEGHADLEKLGKQNFAEMDILFYY